MREPRPGKRRNRFVVAFAIALLTAAGPLAAQSAEWYEMSSRRQTDGIERLEADIEYAVGRLEVEPVDADLLYQLDLRYDARRFEPIRRWSADEGTGHLRLRFDTDDDGFDMDDFDDVHGDELGGLTLGLSRDVPTRLSLGVMAAEARLQLGGVALERFVFRTGASEASIDFDAVNPVRIDRLELAAGAADFRASDLGNARFDRLEFVGAVGDVRLDFGGEWEGNAEAEISMGLGSLKLTFPRDLGVQIDKRGILTSFDSVGFDEVDGAYRTPNWDSASSRLDLSIRAGFGDIDVTFVD
ncbi:MAG: hypothetical protein ACOC9N_02135 [Gemmatimonadota bacterium]